MRERGLNPLFETSEGWRPTAADLMLDGRREMKLRLPYYAEQLPQQRRQYYEWPAMYRAECRAKPRLV